MTLILKNGDYCIYRTDTEIQFRQNAPGEPLAFSMPLTTFRVVAPIAELILGELSSARSGASDGGHGSETSFV